MAIKSINAGPETVSGERSAVFLTRAQIKALVERARLSYEYQPLTNSGEIISALNQLGVNDIFTAIVMVLNRRIKSPSVTLTSLMGEGYELKEIHKLDAEQRQLLRAFYDSSNENGEAAFKTIGERTGHNVNVIDDMVGDIYRVSGVASNTAQLAVLAYALVRPLTDYQIFTLETIANLDYEGNINERMLEIFNVYPKASTRRVSKIERRLGTSDIFSAVTVAINRGILSVDELVSEEVLNGLGRTNDTGRQIMDLYHNSALSSGHATSVTVGTPLSSPENTRRAISRISDKMGRPLNRAQFAVVAYATVSSANKK
jgi:hypothetical protein